MKLELVRVYTKDLSLENPLAPGIYGEEWNPEVDMRLHAGGTRLEGNLLEATLQVNVEARIGGRPAMVVEVVVGGLFAIGEAVGNELARAIGVTCPSVLYPYASRDGDRAIGTGRVSSLSHAAGRFRRDLPAAGSRRPGGGGRGGGGSRRLTRTPVR